MWRTSCGKGLPQKLSPVGPAPLSVRRRTQAVERDGDQPSDGGSGRQRAGGRDRVQAVGRQLAGSDVVAEVAGVCGLGEQLAEELAEMLLGARGVLSAMQQGGDLAAVVLVPDERVGLEHRCESLGGRSRLLGEAGELSQVTGDLPLVPRVQDRLDVSEVLVERRAADAGLLGDLRHRHRPQAVCRNEGGRDREDGVFHRASVLVDRLLPEPRHAREYTSRLVPVRGDLTVTPCLARLVS
jgi:hypothetical protein